MYCPNNTVTSEIGFTSKHIIIIFGPRCQAVSISKILSIIIIIIIYSYTHLSAQLDDWRDDWTNRQIFTCWPDGSR